MTPKRKHYISVVGILSMLALSGLSGYITGSKVFIFPALLSIFVYAIWNLAFSCKKCGNPYLYEFKGFSIVPKTFPSRCRNCGWPTNVEYSNKAD